MPTNTTKPAARPTAISRSTAKTISSSKCWNTASIRTRPQTFFAWYNDEHRHSGLGLLTPAMVHHGQAPLILAQRQKVLNAAYLIHPERFVRFAPKPATLPKEVWINKPPDTVKETQ